VHVMNHKFKSMQTPPSSTTTQELLFLLRGLPAEFKQNPGKYNRAIKGRDF